MSSQCQTIPRCLFSVAPVKGGLAEKGEDSWRRNPSRPSTILNWSSGFSPQVEEPWEVLLQRYLEMAIDTGHFIVKQEWPERTDMAEDIALESFGKAHFGLHTFNQDLSFPAWLRTIVANTARDRIRKERGPKYSRHTHHTDHLDEMATDEETPVSSLIHREDRDFARRHMETMLHSLTHSEQELLLDRFLRRLPIDVIAGKLHLAEQTVRGNLTRAKQTLLRKLNLPENLTNREVEQLLLPIVQALHISLDDVVQAAPQEGPFNQLKPQPWNGMVRMPLARQIGPIQAFKLIVPAGRSQPDPQAHDGRMWMYVLSGSLRLVLGENDLQVRVGESAEFCTRLPHWFGNNCQDPAEVLCLFGRQGEQIRPRVVPSTRHSGDQVAATVPSVDTLYTR